LILSSIKRSISFERFENVLMYFEGICSFFKVILFSEASGINLFKPKYIIGKSIAFPLPSKSVLYLSGDFSVFFCKRVVISFSSSKSES